MDLSVIMPEVLLRWPIWENKLEKELMDLMLLVILPLLLVKDLLLDLLLWSPYHSMVVSFIMLNSQKLIFPLRELIFLLVFLLVLCYLICSLHSLSDRLVKLLLVWLRKLGDKLGKILEFLMELSNLIIKLVSESQLEPHWLKWLLLELW